MALEAVRCGWRAEGWPAATARASPLATRYGQLVVTGRLASTSPVLAATVILPGLGRGPGLTPKPPSAFTVLVPRTGPATVGPLYTVIKLPGVPFQ